MKCQCSMPGEHEVEDHVRRIEEKHGWLSIEEELAEKEFWHKKRHNLNPKTRLDCQQCDDQEREEDV